MADTPFQIPPTAFIPPLIKLPDIISLTPSAAWATPCIVSPTVEIVSVTPSENPICSNIFPTELTIIPSSSILANKSLKGFSLSFSLSFKFLTWLARAANGLREFTSVFKALIRANSSLYWSIGILALLASANLVISSII